MRKNTANKTIIKTYLAVDLSPSKNKDNFAQKSPISNDSITEEKKQIPLNSFSF
jgi:hypothetical protein